MRGTPTQLSGLDARSSSGGRQRRRRRERNARGAASQQQEQVPPARRLGRAFSQSARELRANLPGSIRRLSRRAAPIAFFQNPPTSSKETPQLPSSCCSPIHHRELVFAAGRLTGRPPMLLSYCCFAVRRRCGLLRHAKRPPTGVIAFLLLLHDTRGESQCERRRRARPEARARVLLAHAHMAACTRCPPSPTSSPHSSP